MIIQQLDKYIQENRSLIQKVLTLKIFKTLAPHAQDFITSILSRDIVNPFIENRIAGYITLTRNIYTLSTSPKVIRTIISERINERILGKILELISSCECLRTVISVAYGMYTTLQNTSIVEALLMSSDPVALSRIENILDEVRLVDFVDYNFTIDTEGNLTINLVFQAKTVRDTLKIHAGKLEVLIHPIVRGVLNISIRVSKAIEKLCKLNEMLASKAEVREGMLSYYIV